MSEQQLIISSWNIGRVFELTTRCTWTAFKFVREWFYSILIFLQRDVFASWYNWTVGSSTKGKILLFRTSECHPNGYLFEVFFFLSEVSQICHFTFWLFFRLWFYSCHPIIKSIGTMRSGEYLFDSASFGFREFTRIVNICIAVVQDCNLYT